MEKYVQPGFNKKEFHCPFCGVYAHQEWYHQVVAATVPGRSLTLTATPPYNLCQCAHCKGISVWNGRQLIFPVTSLAPAPNDDMPEDVKEDYFEASRIVALSPRSAAALLRLALQKMMPHLGERSADLDKDIGGLVKKGLPKKIQQALDSLRVIGNNAVHPGQMDLKDDKETANALFQLLNIVVDTMITQPRQISELYAKLPTGAREAIKKRDRDTDAESHL
ncbi:MAG: DUF4145 domain-containing protein [Candidatus Paceibacterota bacterium]